jgi:hypothetical protein
MESGPSSLLEFQLVVARFVLGVIPSDELPPAADRALTNGVYSDALMQLAGSGPERAEVAPLIRKTVTELGVPWPSKRDAAWLLTRSCVGRMISDFRPAEALALLRDVVEAARDVLPNKDHVGDGLDVARLYGLFWSYTEPTENFYAEENRFITDEAERQHLLDRTVRVEAQRWLERNPPCAGKGQYD